MAALASPTALPDAPAYMLPDVSIFASGVFRGKRWAPDVVREICANIKRLGPDGEKLHLASAAPGHEDDDGWQEFVRTDEPSAGWIDPRTAKVIPDPKHKGEVILKASVVNVPREMAEEIRSGRYKFGSSEIYDNFLDDMGRKYGKALRKFSYLGSEPPQVKRLGPLPQPQPMTTLRQFSELRQGILIRVRKNEAGHCFAEAIAVDRNQLTAAAKAGLPNLSTAFLDGLSDDKLAELVKSVPTPQQPQPQAAPQMGMTPPGMPPAQPVTAPVALDPSQEFADMTRDEMIAKLVEAGEGTAEELAAMSDEELQAMLDAPPEGGDGGGETEDMGDPAAMSREEMIAELSAAGQDPTALEAMPDEELRALYAQVTGAATAQAPAAPAAPAMMSERRPARTVAKESKVLLNNLRRLNTFAEREGRRLKAASAANKKRDAEQFCERLVSEGRVTPAQKDAFVMPLLLLLDDTHAAHKFSENGVTRKLSAYAVKKAQLAKLAPVVRFGERLGSDLPSGEAEEQKVERFAEQTFPDQKVRAEYVGKFKAIRAKKPEFTAKDFGVNPVHA